MCPNGYGRKRWIGEGWGWHNCSMHRQLCKGRFRFYGSEMPELHVSLLKVYSFLCFSDWETCQHNHEIHRMMCKSWDGDWDRRWRIGEVAAKFINRPKSLKLWLVCLIRMWLVVCNVHFTGTPWINSHSWILSHSKRRCIHMWSNKVLSSFVFSLVALLSPLRSPAKQSRVVINCEVCSSPSLHQALAN